MSNSKDQVANVYQNMWQRAWPLIKNNQIYQDPFLAGETDSRRGITLLARLQSPITDAIREFLAEIKKYEPHQYFYPISDLHITILSIVSCREGYHFQQHQKPEYIDLITDIIRHTPSFDIEFRGLTLADTGIILQGFVTDDSLAQLRAELRKKIKSSSVEHSIDSRYTLMTAHCSILRFCQPLLNSHKLTDFLEANRERYFGLQTISSMELVVNDWYQSNEHTELLSTINLFNP